MGDFSVLGTRDYRVGEDNMWEECNYLFKCEGDRQRFVITFEVQNSWRPPASVFNEHVRRMINAMNVQGADRLNNRTLPDEQSTSQLPGGEPRTEVFQVTKLQRLKNEQNDVANAAIVEIDTDANHPSYPNQLALFELAPPEDLNFGHVPSSDGPFKKARAFPVWGDVMVLVKTREIRAGKKPEVQTWYPCFNSVYKLREGKCEYKENVSYSNFRSYHP